MNARVLTALVGILVGIAATYLYASYFVPKDDGWDLKPEGGNGGYSYADQSEKKVWLDQDYLRATEEYIAYELKYPRDFDIFRGEQAIGGTLGPTRSRVQIAFPADALEAPRTNFSEAYLTVSILYDATEETCFADLAGGRENSALSGRKTINGQEFRMGETMGAAAGNFYESKVYRTLYRGRCYEIEETLHTTNIGVYEPGTVREFDAEKAWTILHDIRDTFRVSAVKEPVSL